MRDLTGLKLLAKFPIENIWMLAVDGSFYAKENGPVGFDTREKNSVQGIINGLKTALDGLGKDLTVDHIHAIHKSCMTGIVSRNHCIPGEIRNNSVAMEVFPSWTSLSGLQDLINHLLPTSRLLPVRFLSDGRVLIPIEKIPVDDRNKYKAAAVEHEAFTPANTNDITLKKNYELFLARKISLTYQPPASVTALQLAKLTENYNARIKQVNTKDEKLKIIAEVIQQYTRHHVYRDGNNRSQVNCLIIELLVGNGLCPALFFEPNIFEFHTIDELVEIIKKGQLLFMSIINKPQEPVYNFDNSKIKAIEDGKYINMGKDFQKALNELIYKMGKAYYLAKEFSLASECFAMNYELEKKLTGDESPTTATTLYNLASTLKELGQLQKGNAKDATQLQEARSQLQQAKSQFDTVIVLFGKNNNNDSLEKSRKKLAEIDSLLAELTNLNNPVVKP